jgi:hypothetical protein
MMTYLTCHHCGLTGVGVSWWRMHIGGQGTVQRPACDNLRQCWNRWDRAHGFAPREVTR